MTDKPIWERLQEISDSVPPEAWAEFEKNRMQGKWQPIETAPKGKGDFILLYCAEDGTRWLAKWQGDQWYGVDELGLTRQAQSYGDPNYVTGWFVNAWMPLPEPPVLAQAQDKHE